MIMCSSHKIFMTRLPHRTVEKHRIQSITVGLFSFYLLQRVCWFQWLLILFVLARRHVDSVIADSFVCPGMLVVSLASAYSPTQWLEAVCRVLDSQKDRPCGLREASPFSDSVNRWIALQGLMSLVMSSALGSRVGRGHCGSLALKVSLSCCSPVMAGLSRKTPLRTTNWSTARPWARPCWKLYFFIRCVFERSITSMWL